MSFRPLSLLLFLFLIGTLAPSPSLAQNSYIGIQGGAGGGAVALNEGYMALPPVVGITSPYTMLTQDHFSGGLTYRWIPSSDSLKWEKAVGLEYRYRRYGYDGELRIHEFRVPLMLGINFGSITSKWNVVPSFGLFASIPFDHNKTGKVGRVPKASMGYKMRVDLRYRASSSFTVLLGFEASNSLTSTYYRTWYLASGRVGGEDPKKSLEGELRLSFLYQLSSLLGEDSKK